ncbi:MAG TPA: arginine repressor [Gemmatimonadales bacterium]
MKTQRHAAIVELVRTTPIKSQEQLRASLADRGIEVTQATLSRDIRELGLVKVTDPGGGAVYSAPPAEEVVHAPLAQLVGALLIAVDGAGVLLVVRTTAGSANALARVIDHAAWPEIVGTIAGDDTILIVARSDRARRVVAARLGNLARPDG